MACTRMHSFARMQFIVTLGASLAIAAANVQPNFLLLFPDQWRYDWTPANTKVPLRMPQLSALLSQGTSFSQAYVPSPLCAPSRSCLASGREFDYADVPGNNYNYNTSIPTFYNLLRAAGWHTMTSGKDDLTKGTGPFINGSRNADVLGFSDYERCEGKEDVTNNALPADPYGAYCFAHNTTVDGHAVSLWDVLKVVDKDCCSPTEGGGSTYDCAVPSAIPQPAYEDDWVTANALALLDRKPPGAPWFMHVSFPGPHPPFIVTSQMMNETGKERVWPLAVDNKGVPAPAQQQIRRDYASELENLDSLMSSIIAKVVSLGEMDNTYVILASDHGEMLGDHDDWGKIMPWQGSVSVPLIFVAPALGVNPGKVVGDPVATLDIAGTILDLAGVQPAAGMTTTSLRGFLFGDAGKEEAGSIGVQQGRVHKDQLSPYRPFIASGLDQWRLVVKPAAANGTNAGKIFKLVCCAGEHCIGQPGNVSHAGYPSLDEDWSRHAQVQERRGNGRGKDEGVRVHGVAADFTLLLFETVSDPFDLSDVKDQYPGVVSAMKPLLPTTWC